METSKMSFESCQKPEKQEKPEISKVLTQHELDLLQFVKDTGSLSVHLEYVFDEACFHSKNDVNDSLRDALYYLKQLYKIVKKIELPLYN